MSKVVTKEDWAYLAGLIEANGSFSITFCNERIFGSSLYISNSHPDIYDWLIDNFRGTITTKKTNLKKTPIKRNEYRYWTCSHFEKLRICKGVLPYVKARKRNCEIMIEMRKLVESTRLIGQHLEEEEIAERMELYFEMREANNKYRKSKLMH